MPTKLQEVLLIAAIEGFEEQKKLIDLKIAGLRQMLAGTSRIGAAAEGGKPPRKMAATNRRRIDAAQLKRLAARRNERGDTGGTRKKQA